MENEDESKIDAKRVELSHDHLSSFAHFSSAISSSIIFLALFFHCLVRNFFFRHRFSSNILDSAGGDYNIYDLCI